MENENNPFRASDLFAPSYLDAIRAAMSRERPSLSDHLHIGKLFFSLFENAIALYTAEHGDTESNRRYAKDAVYAHIETTFGSSRAAVRLYIRCYQHFGEAFDSATHTVRDMLMRLDGPVASAA